MELEPAEQAERVRVPSAHQQAAVTVVLVIADVSVVAWLFWGYAWTGWADTWDQNNAPVAPRVAWRAVWILAGVALVTGIGLLALGWRTAGVIQLSVLDFCGTLFAYWAIRG
ncbi:hypothetical protein [Streptomyces sp. NPDC102360]|uniref:hypothetical protein n=1 Tax=Streptomyces sp. NPDC102360 TaxID=3366160 RepID=UPI0037FF357F